MYFKQNNFNQAKTTEPKFDNNWSIRPHRRKRGRHRRVYSELQNSVDKIPNKENISIAGMHRTKW
jgi:hypothetical protein